MKIIADIKTARSEIEKLEKSIEPVEEKISQLKGLVHDKTVVAEKELADNNAELIEKMEAAGAEDIFFDIESVDRNTWFEDDGTLHIVVGKVRACFPWRGQKAAVAKAKKFGITA